MPYTDVKDRDWDLPDPGYSAHSLAHAINVWLRDLKYRRGLRTPGILVWGICELSSRWSVRHPRCFDTWFDVIHALRIAETNIGAHPEELAALDCARLEFYRRILAPYEDLARQRNGEVWDVSLLVAD